MDHTEGYSIRELMTLQKEVLERKKTSSVARRPDLGETQKFNSYDRLINYHWRMFEEKVRWRRQPVFVSILLIGSTIALALLYLIIGILNALPAGRLLTPMALGIVCFLTGYILSKYGRFSEFQFKPLLNFMLVSCGIFFCIYFFISLLESPSAAFFEIIPIAGTSFFLSIFGFYLGHMRILGRGEVHLFAVRLLTDFENRPGYERYALTHCNGLLKGIDDWVFERLGLRIENLTEIKKICSSRLIINYTEIQAALEPVFSEEFFRQLHGQAREFLVGVLQKLQNIFGVRLHLNRETLKTFVGRNLSKLGVVSTIIGVLGTIFGFITPFL